MKKYQSKFGTDSRYPVWSGGRIDPKTINGFAAIALFLNWGALINTFVPFVLTNGNNPTLWFTVRIVIAITICIATMLPIRHSDRSVQRFTRGFASGIPLVIIFSFVVVRIITWLNAHASGIWG